jgi:hypothetical protein
MMMIAPRSSMTKGLAPTLDGSCDLSAHADAEEMRQVAVGIKATAIHALLTAADVAGMSERLNTVAAVLEAVIPDSEPPAPIGDETRGHGAGSAFPGPPASPIPAGGILRSMEALKAVVKNGRLVLDEATDLPEGAEVELAVVHDHDGDNELLEELEASAADEAAGNLVDFDAVIARLGSKP